MKDDPGPQVFRFGACTLDLERGTLERSGALVPIRAKTYRLLSHLARNAGRVLSKGELLDAVWHGVTVTEDSLTQAVGDLRRAIGDDSQQIVRTIARRGYLFVLPLDPPESGAGHGVAQPRVAVLPFRNLTGDADTGIVLDGIVEEITNGLARFKTVTVIARHSAFAFRPDERPALEAVGARLGADYLIDGSARRAGERLMITLGLCDAQSGRQLWGDKFEGAGDDLLSLHEEIPRRIIGRLVSNIEHSVLSRSAASPTASLTAFEHFTRAVALLRSYGEGVNERGRGHLLRAIEIDPGYGLAHAYLAFSEVMIAEYGMAPRDVLDAAKVKAMTAVDLSPEESRCHRILGYIRSLLQEHAAAEQTVRRAHDLNPYDAETLLHMSVVLNARGRAAEALEWIDRAIALNPLHPVYYHIVRSYPLYHLGRYDEAANELDLMPRLGARAETRMAAILAMAGRMEEAARHLDRAEARVPGWQHLAMARRSYHFEHEADREHLLAGIQAALDARAGLARIPQLSR